MERKCMGCGELGCICWDTRPYQAWSYDENRWFFKWRRYPARKWPWLVLLLGVASLILFRI